MRPTFGLIAAALLSSAVLPAAGWAQATEESPPDRVRVILPERVHIDRRGRIRIDPPPAPAPALPLEPIGAPARDSSIDADRLPGVVAPPPSPPPPTQPGVMYSTVRTYGDLRIVGAGIEEFFYLRQDILLELGSGPAVIPLIEQGGNYGPHPIGATVRVTKGANYVILPVCRGAISWNSKRLAALPKTQAKGQVALLCRR